MDSGKQALTSGVALRTLKVWIALWKVADEHYRDLNACIFCWCWYLASWVVQKNIKGKKSLHLLHKSKWHIPHKTKSNAEKINSNISRLFLNRYKAQFQCHMLGSVASLTKTTLSFIPSVLNVCYKQKCKTNMQAQAYLTFHVRIFG